MCQNHVKWHRKGLLWLSSIWYCIMQRLLEIWPSLSLWIFTTHLSLLHLPEWNLFQSRNRIHRFQFTACIVFRTYGCFETISWMLIICLLWLKLSGRSHCLKIWSLSFSLNITAIAIKALAVYSIVQSVWLFFYWCKIKYSIIPRAS